VLRIALLLVALGGLSAALVFWVLPAYLRNRCIEEAAAHGITLAIDDASLDSHGFRLLGVMAKAAAFPGAQAHVPEMEVETSGLNPTRMTVRGAELTLTGPWRTLNIAFGAWRASPRGGQGGAWAPNELVVEDSRLVWQAPFAENAHVEAANLHLDVAWGGVSTTIHGRSDKVLVAVPGGRVGPWRVDVDRTRTPPSSRVRIALDPAVPDASTVLIVGGDEASTSVDVVIPRSPVERLGLPPELLGLRGKALQIEMTAHFRPAGSQRADATSKGGIYGIEAGLPMPFDVAWDAAASGDPRSGLDVKKARLAVGPLVGALSGTLKTFDDGFRVDLAWAAGPVPCTAFDAPLGAGDPFDIAYQLRKLAQGVGLAKVAGEVSARGGLTFDSRDLGSTRVDFTPDVKCKASLFGP
jgi:hypothetical protein